MSESREVNANISLLEVATLMLFRHHSNLPVEEHDEVNRQEFAFFQFLKEMFLIWHDDGICIWSVVVNTFH